MNVTGTSLLQSFADDAILRKEKGIDERGHHAPRSGGMLGMKEKDHQFPTGCQ
jgi:hypothetical protein